VNNTCDHCCTKITGLSVKFGAVPILENIDIHLNCREIVALIGPNGAGKTTLLRALLGEIPFAGSVNFIVKGKAVKYPRIGYVPQRLNLDVDSPVSVMDFMVSASHRTPVWLGVRPSSRRKVIEALSRVSAQDLAKKRIGELSGGQLQRVLLAMAMSPVPDLLLLDESASGIDINGLALFYRIVDELRNRHDVSVILVTHDLGSIAPHADRIILINGRVLCEGKPEEVLRDEKMFKAFGLSLKT